MGRRDDYFMNDDQADAELQRVLRASGHPRFVEPPPDLVTATLRRLPPLPPAQAARRERRRHALRLAAASMVLLLALLGIFSLIGGAQLAFLFGDGSSGLSSVLLALHLLAKPLLRSTGDIIVPLLVGSLAAALLGGWLWWWLIRQTPVAMPVELE